ncbi:MAG: hypothetical protein ACREID_00775, partial [Planctomycetota bacterium]
MFAGSAELNGRRVAESAGADAASRDVAPSRVAPILVPFLRGIYSACPRMLRLYPAGHSRVQAHIDELCRLADDLFRERPHPLALTVRASRLVVDGEAVEGVPEITEPFALALRHRRIRSLELRPGLGRDEILLLAALLGADHRTLHRDGGTEAFLARRPHPHLDVVVGGSPHGRAAAEDADPTGEDVLPSGMAGALE